MPTNSKLHAIAGILEQPTSESLAVYKTARDLLTPAPINAPSLPAPDARSKVVSCLEQDTVPTSSCARTPPVAQLPAYRLSLPHRHARKYMVIGLPIISLQLTGELQSGCEERKLKNRRSRPNRTIFTHHQGKGFSKQLLAKCTP